MRLLLASLSRYVLLTLANSAAAQIEVEPAAPVKFIKLWISPSAALMCPGNHTSKQLMQQEGAENEEIYFGKQLPVR